MTRLVGIALAASMIAAPAALDATEVDVTLRGSRASMQRQNQIAKAQAYSFLRTPTQVLRFVDNGYLVRLEGSGDYTVLAGYPYARPVVRAFIERLAADYRFACGEQLVVTSLTRPSLRQPRNASALSVHPAGMAVDLRVSARAACRDWLSAELLTLEDRGLIDGTREYHPPHFHVAVFPAFEAYDQTLRAMAAAEESVRLLEQAAAERVQHASEQAEREAVDAAAAADTAAIAAALRPPLIVRVAAALALLVLPLAV